MRSLLRLQTDLYIFLIFILVLPRYHDAGVARELMLTSSQTLLQRQVAGIKSSPFYSVIIDEALGIDKGENLVVMIEYLSPEAYGFTSKCEYLSSFLFLEIILELITKMRICKRGYHLALSIFFF